MNQRMNLKMIKELEPIADALVTSHQQLLQAIEGLTEDDLRVPFPGRDWSIHDTLEHLAANEALMTELAVAITEGQRTNLPEDFDNDRFNAETHAARRDKPMPEIRQEIDRNQRRLSEFLSRVKPEQLERRGTHPLQGELNLREFLPVIYSHRVTHTRDIVEQTRRLRSATPNIARTPKPPISD